MKASVLSDLTLVLPERELSREEIQASAAGLVDPALGDDERARFLRAWTERGETAFELATSAEAFLPMALDPGVHESWQGKALLDCCGTGGGGLSLLNISTGLMFLLAAMGIPVVKHGNRGQTKKSGSADVLEALGIKIDLPPAHVPTCLEEVGCAFLFAPAYHPAFAAVASVRRLLAAEGRRTIFNLLGPLLNPARPDARLVGVFKTDHIPLYQDALEEMRCPHFSVVCGQDQASQRMLGEASAQGVTYIGSTLAPADGAPLSQLEWIFSETPPSLAELLVKDASESAARLTALFRRDEKGLAREMLLLNAALAGWTHGTASSLEEGLAQATHALDSGAAHERLKRWQEFSAR